MSYKISAGIKEDELPEWLGKALKKYGRYKDGGVDYTDAPIAPAVMCTVICDEEILLVKRAYGLADAEGYWSVVNGFIDEIKPVKEIAKKEVKEELGLEIDTGAIKVAWSFTVSDPKEKRSYVIFPCLITLQNKPDITLDREHTDFAWIKRNQLESYEILDDLPYVVDAALSLK